MKNTVLIFVLLFASIWHASAQQPGDLRADVNSRHFPFFHGVASGDPLADAVIIWTRVTVDNQPVVNVRWEVALDTNFTQVVDSGSVSTDASKDFTVKVDVRNLQPDTWYFYRFKAVGRKSVTGRTRTLPVGNVQSMRFAVVSCANYQAGYFNAYRNIANRNDVDAVIHLGDYIYEYETGAYGYDVNIGREHDPDWEILSLSDYRIRYSHYRLDPDLRRVHQLYPFISVWDDHESANDAWKDGAENHDPATEGSWQDRKAASIQAYHEWLPIRDNPVSRSIIYRNFVFGDLVALHMLDTRLLARDEQDPFNTTDPNRKLIGDQQLQWLDSSFVHIPSRWHLLGQQVMVAPLEIFGIPVNVDQWDGYAAERGRLFNAILADTLKNVVVLTGDIHSSWANDLPLSGYNNSNPDSVLNSVAVEFVTTSVTSPGFPFGVPISTIQLANRHVRWANLDRRGYMILDINRQRIQCDWYLLNTVAQPDTTQSVGASWFVNHGETFLRQASAPAAAQSTYPVIPAETPDNPPYSTVENYHPLQVIGFYPNPVTDHITMQVHLRQPMTIIARIYSMDGKLAESSRMHTLYSGLHMVNWTGLNLQNGQYLLTIEDQQGNIIARKSFIKMQ